MADLSSGTLFGTFDTNKSMRLSNRDIILVIGIVVAVVVALTTLVYHDQLEQARKEISTPRKTSMNTTLRFIEFIGKHSSVTHSR